MHLRCTRCTGSLHRLKRADASTCVQAMGNAAQESFGRGNRFLVGILSAGYIIIMAWLSYFPRGMLNMPAGHHPATLCRS